MAIDGARSCLRHSRPVSYAQYRLSRTCGFPLVVLSIFVQRKVFLVVVFALYFSSLERSHVELHFTDEEKKTVGL